MVDIGLYVHNNLKIIADEQGFLLYKSVMIDGDKLPYIAYDFTYSKDGNFGDFITTNHILEIEIWDDNPNQTKIEQTRTKCLNVFRGTNYIQDGVLYRFELSKIYSDVIGVNSKSINRRCIHFNVKQFGNF
jgi:hypothetical protein